MKNFVGKKGTILLCLLFIITMTINTVGNTFSDVNHDDWYYDSISFMSEYNYIKGYDDGEFKPYNKVTCAELVSIVGRIKHIQEKNPQYSNHWAASIMEGALEVGWFDWDEIPPTAEKYNEPITRQLAVKIVMNAFAPNVSGDYNTETAKIADFGEVDGRYYNAVIGAYSIGLVKGDNNRKFNPKGNLTRAEACVMIMNALNISGESVTPVIESEKSNEIKTVDTVSGGVSENGFLSVKGSVLYNETGKNVVLRGMSSHGVQWYPDFLSYNAIKATRDYGANLFRVAMYTEENGYIYNNSVKNTVIKAVDDAVSLDMYVIIDWHILSDGNPNTHKAEAKAFFAEMAERYKDNPAVIYEICNEPNGNITWSGDVKPYAEEIINVIRNIDSRALILVGSTSWSQDLQEVVKSPIDAENIMYTCHFYSGTHTQWLRDRIKDALNNNIPVFVSEWGTSDASGNGGVFVDESEKWLEFMEENNISWANWSLCNKNETSAALSQGAVVEDGISDNELSESGRLVFERFK